jgi:hypothetical protein
VAEIRVFQAFRSRICVKLKVNRDLQKVLWPSQLLVELLFIDVPDDNIGPVGNLPSALLRPSQEGHFNDVLRQGPSYPQLKTS